MGCDIHSFVEIKKDGKWIRNNEKVFAEWNNEFTSEPFGWRSYNVFGFLADVRNYAHITPISEPKGLPDDSEWLNAAQDNAYEINPMNGEPIPYNEREKNKDYILESDYHSHSWLTLKELTDFDYNKTLWNRRVTKQDGPNSWNGAALAEEGEGTIETYEEHLGSGFKKHLDTLKQLGTPENVRIVFWFDN